MLTLDAWLERLAYAVARGVTRAYLDVLRERDQAEEEHPNEADRRRADRVRDAVRRLRAQDHDSAGP